jgi:Fe-S oxidoreductase
MFQAFEVVPAYPLVFPVFWGAFAIFALVVARHLRVFAEARAGGPQALDQFPRRAWGVVEYAILQTRMFREGRVGVMHLGLFLGSTLLLIGNANAVTGGLLQAVVAWPLDGVLWTILSAVQNAVALAAFAAVAYAFERRLVSRPARLLFTRTALIILTMIFAVVSTEFLAQSFEAARYGDIAGAFAANALGVALRGLGPNVTETAFVVLWWGHILVLSGFLIYIQFNKHFHVYTSFVNVYFRKLAPRGELPAMDLEREDLTFGLRTLQDLGWKDVLDGFTCTECGRCQDACPANRTGKPLDPRALIMGIRRMSVEAEQGIDLIPNSPIVREVYGLDDTRPDATRLARPIVGDAISYDAVWDCVTCGACVEACPVLIEHVDKIVGLRRNLVLEDSRFPQELTAAFTNMERAGNPWGQPKSTRTDWTKNLPFEVPTVAELSAAGQLDEVEVLYWVGCAAAFDERNRRVARAFATCLHAAGVRFAILGQEESCTGDPARRMGNDYVWQMLAAGNIATLDRYRLTSIVTACPHCFNTIGNEYAQLGGRYEVVHHSVYLQRLLAQGRIRTFDPTAAEATGPNGAAGPAVPARTVTFHDSCYLARYNGVMAEPRAILGAVPGLELREMERNGRGSFCCGAGGGRMWMEETRGTRINAERTRQALETGASTVATSCPFCMTMLSDGLASVDGNATGLVSAIDVAELLSQSLVPAPNGGRSLTVLQ